MLGFVCCTRIVKDLKGLRPGKQPLEYTDTQGILDIMALGYFS